MNDKNFREYVLKQLKKFDERLMKFERSAVINKSKRKKTSSKVADGKRSLSDHIITLREQMSFKHPATPEEIHKKLEAIYPCEFSRVKVELIRLQKRGKLRKASKMVGKKKYVAYVW